MSEGKIMVCEAKVVSNKPVAKNIWELQLDPGLNADNAVLFIPGQFVCLEPLDPISVMARPFSISNVSMLNGTFKLLYKIVGKNTELMTRLQAGSCIKFRGPLGQESLHDSTAYDEVCLVGGGIGIAPLIFYEKVFTELQNGLVRVFYGNKTKDEIIPLDLYTKEKIEIATDDGSAGYEGMVTDLLQLYLNVAVSQKKLVITCGPNMMMKKVAEICAGREIDCYVILEKIMACGIGQCLGCSIKTKSGMKKICADGPIFKAEEVIWDELN